MMNTLVILIVIIVLLILLYEIFKKHEELKNLKKLEDQEKEKLLEIEEEKKFLDKKLEEIKVQKETNELFFNKLEKKYYDKILELANKTEQEIEKIVFERAEEKNKNELYKKEKEYEEHLKENKIIIANKILLQAMENTAVDLTNELTNEDIKLPNDEMKGKFIGKDGRNIKLFENLVKVNLIIDERPNIISVSSLNPVRRAIAQKVVQELVDSGIINQITIEETYLRHEHAIETIILEKGKWAFRELDINTGNIDFALIRMVGKLFFRSSYGQNVLQHSIEVGKICKIIANELNLDNKIAVLAGLLHDIGKTESQETGEAHDLLGKKMIMSYINDSKILNAVEAHHGRVETESEYAVIVQIADSISASRSGARNATHDNYIERINKMEEIALDFPEVEKVFALSGGKEIRIIVKCEKVSDIELHFLGKKIKEKIESNLIFPGVIKINLIRESRYALEAGKRRENV